MIVKADESSSAKVFVTVFVLLIILAGGGVFLFLTARYKITDVAPKTRAGGYKKLDTNGGVAENPAASSYGDLSEKFINREEDEEDDGDDDIVYMGQDGTVYRRFKYGLLDDEEIELEYDDESFSYK